MPSLILPTGRGWTRRHALFLMMGGFVLTKDGLPIQTVSPQLFRRLIPHNAIEFSTISTAGIQERCNLHPILAVLALLQAVWFAVQCLSRVISGLLITQLEVTTLTLVFSCAIILPFVRQKPLDVRRPVFVPITPQFDLNHLIYDLAYRGLVSDDFKREKRQNHLVKQIAVVERRHRYRLSTTSFTMRCLRNLVVWPIEALFGDFGDLVVNFRSTSKPRPGDLKVPLFYVPNSSDHLFAIIIPIACTLGMGIGVAHCLYWSWGHFPSAFARLLWRVNSVITTGFYAVCLVITLITAMFSLFYRLPSHIVFDVISQAFAVASVLFLCISLLPFIAARIILLVESFWCLKSLPQEALEIVPWTRFIPHFS